MMNQINEKAKEIAALKALDFTAMSTKEMAQWFGINRFADRKSAERRCGAKLADMLAVAEEELLVLESRLAAASKSKLKSKPVRTASEGIAESWKNVEVFNKRTTRNGVIVNGQEYKSVRAAFYALGLPENKHIAFRMALKEEKAKTFILDGEKFEFHLI
ncbi:hypothetical protein Gekk315_00053 [Aeromonas phage Gekk3-15]